MRDERKGEGEILTKKAQWSRIKMDNPPTYLPTYLTTYPPTHLPTYLPTYLYGNKQLNIEVV